MLSNHFKSYGYRIKEDCGLHVQPTLLRHPITSGHPESKYPCSLDTRSSKFRLAHYFHNVEGTFGGTRWKDKAAIGDDWDSLLIRGAADKVGEGAGQAAACPSCTGTYLEPLPCLSIAVRPFAIFTAELHLARPVAEIVGQSHEARTTRMLMHRAGSMIGNTESWFTTAGYDTGNSGTHSPNMDVAHRESK